MALRAQAARRVTRTPPRHYSFWRLVRANVVDAARLLSESYKALLGFLVLVLAGTIYFRVKVGTGIVESIYNTLQLLAFQINHFPTDPYGQILFFLVPVLGIVLIIQSVIKFGRLLLDKGGRIEDWQTSLAWTFRNHVIVCGLGRVGFRAVTRLIASGFDVVVIEGDWDSEFVPRALALKVPVVRGDAREAHTLRLAGISRARALLAVIDGDLTDIEIALAARAERQDLRLILRAFSDELDRSLERTFGQNSVFSTSELAAPTFAAACVSRDLDYVLPVGDGDGLLGVSQIVMPSGDRIAETRAQLEQQFGVRLLHTAEASGAHVGWNAARAFRPGDLLTLLGPTFALEAVRVQLALAATAGAATPLPLQHPTPERNTIIVCGLGKVGYRVTRWLSQRDQRPEIVVVTTHEDTNSSFSQQVQAIPGVRLIEGDARDAEVLQQAGIERAFAVAAITADDDANLKMALEARRLNPDVHVVLRVFSDTLAEKMTELFGIHTAYSTSDLAAPTLAAAGAIGGIRHGFTAGGHLFSTIRFGVDAPSRLGGQTVAAIRDATQALVIWVRRGDTITVLPPLDATLAPGDDIIVLARLAALEKLRGALPK